MKAGTQECGTEIRCKGHHDELPCTHCDGTHGYRHNHQVYSLVVQFAGSGAKAKSVHQCVCLRRQRTAKCEVIDLTLSDSDSDGDFIQVKKAKVEPKSLSPRYKYAYLAGLMHVHSNVL